MVPRALIARAPYVDVAAAIEEQPRSRAVSLRMVGGSTETDMAVDPFAGIEV